MGVVDAVVYLLIQAMAEPDIYTAIVEYYINNESPSDISLKLYQTNAMKIKVRGRIQRVYEKAGSHKAAAAAVGISLRLLPRLPEVDGGRCPFCDKRYYRLVQHIHQKHRDRVAAILTSPQAADKSFGRDRRGVVR